MVWEPHSWPYWFSTKERTNFSQINNYTKINCFIGAKSTSRFKSKCEKLRYDRIWFCPSLFICYTKSPPTFLKLLKEFIILVKVKLWLHICCIFDIKMFSICLNIGESSFKTQNNNKTQETPGANRASNNKTLKKWDKIAAEKRRKSSEDTQKDMVDLSIDHK